MTTRLLFIGDNRIADCVLTLKFDKFVSHNFDQTVIHHLPDRQEIINAFDQYGIDYSHMTFVADSELDYQNRPNIEFFGRHHAQQLIKLLALDRCQDEKIVIADADMFCLSTHNYFDTMPVLWYNEYCDDLEHWNSYVTELTGLSARPISFVSESVPILKSDWDSLKQAIEDRSGKNWMVSIINSLSKIRKPFSEYTLLGNWILNQRPDTKLVAQKRICVYNTNKLDTVHINKTSTGINVVKTKFEEIDTIEEFVNKKRMFF